MLPAILHSFCWPQSHRRRTARNPVASADFAFGLLLLSVVPAVVLADTLEILFFFVLVAVLLLMLFSM